MISFKDGPAKGQCLCLKRAPRFLRVVEAGGTWDALDQPEDSPSLDEKLYAYRLSGDLGVCHINRGGGRGGFYKIADYSFIESQPADSEMRHPEKWRAWCESQPL